MTTLSAPPGATAYDVEHVVRRYDAVVADLTSVAGDRAAVRATWRGVVGRDAGPFHAGQVLLAHMTALLTVRDGRVVEHETFDCDEPSDRV